MPVMPRMNKKVRRIAFDILGVPAPLQTRPSKKKKRVNKRLTFEDTVRLR